MSVSGTNVMPMPIDISEDARQQVAEYVPSTGTPRQEHQADGREPDPDERDGVHADRCAISLRRRPRRR